MGDREKVDVTVPPDEPSYDEWLDQFSEEISDQIEESEERDLRWEGGEPPPLEALNMMSDDSPPDPFKQAVNVERELLTKWSPFLESTPYNFLEDSRHRKAIIQLLENAQQALDQTRTDGTFVKGGTLPLVNQDEEGVREFAQSFLRLVVDTYANLDTRHMFSVNALEGPVGFGGYIEYTSDVFSPNNIQVTFEEEEVSVDALLLKTPEGDHQWDADNWYSHIVDPGEREDLAVHLAEQLDRILVETFVSRLYDELVTPMDRLDLPDSDSFLGGRSGTIRGIVEEWSNRIGRRSRRDPDKHHTWLAVTGAQNDIYREEWAWDEVDCVDDVYLFPNPKFDRPIMVVGMQGNSNVLTGNLLSVYHLLQFAKADDHDQSLRSRHGMDLVRPDLYALLSM